MKYNLIIVPVVPAVHVIVLGSAAQLTMGGKGSVWEYMRPNAAYKG